MLQQLLMILAGILSLIGAGAISYSYLNFTVGPREVPQEQAETPDVAVPAKSSNTVTTTTVAKKPTAQQSTVTKPVSKPVTSTTSVATPQKANGSLVPATTTTTKTVVAPAPLRATVSVPSGSSSSLTVQGVIEHTNYQRLINGELPILTENVLLNQDAQIKLSDMFTKQYFEHISPTGVGPADIAEMVGYAYVIVGENLALGDFAGDAGVVTAWMNSPGHRANILNTHYQEIGVAVGKGMYEGHETWIAVQAFGTPLSSCPATDASLKATIASNSAMIADLKIQLDAKKALIDATAQTDPNYNIYVNEFNALIPQYNNLIEINRTNVTNYNAGVQTFNACIAAVGTH